MSLYCRICGSTHSSDEPCPSDEEKAARILAESADGQRARTVVALRADLAAATSRAERTERERDDALFREAGADSLMRAVREELCQIADPAAGSVTIADILHSVRARVDGLSSDLTAARGERDRLRAALGELLAACTQKRNAEYGQTEPDVIDALRFTAEKVRAHSGYDPGQPLDELADRIRAAVDAARKALEKSNG